MTVTIRYPGYPDRLACEHCGCTIAAKRDGEPWRYVLATNTSEWTGVLEVDEPPIHLDLGDGCPCHDAYLALQRNHYDDEQ